MTRHVRRIQARALRALLLVALLLPHAPGCSAIRKPAPWLAPAQPTTPTGRVIGELVIPDIEPCEITSTAPGEEPPGTQRRPGE